jgi:hypothetical protein
MSIERLADEPRGTGLSPKKASACRFGGRKALRPVPIPRFFGGTSIASLMEECGG